MLPKRTHPPVFQHRYFKEDTCLIGPLFTSSHQAAYDKPMLVIHWTMQNKTNQILANGITPSSRKYKDKDKNNTPKGVYVYPYSRNKHLSGVWRRNLKEWDNKLGNYNGFVFKLEESDFPIIAGTWWLNRDTETRDHFNNMKELSACYNDYFSGEIVNKTVDGFHYNWHEIELIIPNRINSNRIIRIIKDRNIMKSELDAQ